MKINLNYITSCISILLISLISCQQNKDRNGSTGHSSTSTSNHDVQGTAKVWQSVTLAFNGPECIQTGKNPNPFLDLRLDVTFTKDNKSYVVPGYFDTDGEGGTRGNIWKVKFTPDEAGTWDYTVSFRSESDIAVSTTPGKSAGFMDGHTGSISIAGPDTDAPGFLSKGRLVCEVGSWYPKTLGDNKYWIKGGCDSPENFLACGDIANTNPNTFDPDQWHGTWANHEIDWQPGDPTWDGGKGKGIIGSLNYLASKEINSIYILLMNIGGDGQDVWPYAGNIDRAGGADVNDNKFYDCRKLQQWNIIFTHAQEKGIVLNLVFGEGEANNKKELDNGSLGIERKLYYREMIARFGHHNAIEWNISEEWNYVKKHFTVDQVNNIAEYIKSVDPYGHPVTVHNYNGDNDGEMWDPFFGNINIDITSYQIKSIAEFTGVQISNRIELLRSLAEKSGRIIPISVDEYTFVGPRDNDIRGEGKEKNMGTTYVRKTHMYPIYFSGGMTEMILFTALKTQDFRQYSKAWEYLTIARKFIENNLPFTEMEPADDLISDYNGHADVFSKHGSVYAIYLPEANDGNPKINIPTGTYKLKWFNPRTGVFTGTSESISGGDVNLYPAPGDLDSDWVVLITDNDS